MTPQAFWSAVHSEASADLPPPWLDLSIDLFVDLGLTKNHADEKKCRQHAQSAYMLHLEQQKKGQQPAQPQTPLTPGIQAVSKSRAKAIAPQVEQIRQKVFGDSAVPFPSYQDAVAWLKQMAKKPVPPQLKQRLETLEQEILTRCIEWAQLTQGASGWTWTQQFIAYNEPGADVMSFFPVPPGSQQLAVVAYAAQRLADLTDFTPYSIVAYILADRPPVLEPATLSWGMTMSEDLGLFREQAILTINTPDLTDEQWRHIRRAIRAGWDVARAKRLTPSDQWFLDLVKKCGGGPCKGKGSADFWQKVCQARNNTAPPDAPRHGSWQASQTLYKRLYDKLQQITAQDEPPAQLFCQAGLRHLPCREFPADATDEEMEAYVLQGMDMSLFGDPDEMLEDEEREAKPAGARLSQPDVEPCESAT